MPEPRWNVISIRDYVYDVLKARAKENHRSIASELEEILEQAKVIPKMEVAKN